MDQSLEDIIKQNKKNKPAKSGGGGGGDRNRKSGGGGGGRGGGVGGGRRGGAQNGGARRRSDPLRRTNQGGVRKQTQERAPARVTDLRQNVGNAERKEAILVISNLDASVTDSDIKELFVEFGELKRANVNYDRNGASLGTAEVIFRMTADAQKAFKQYNGVPLDGKPMDIKLAASQTDVFRSAPAAARSGGFGGNRERRGAGQGQVRGQGRDQRSSGGGGGARGGDRPRTTTDGGRGGGGGGGRRGGRGGGAGGRENRPKVSAEDLDKQLEDYNNGGDGANNGKSDDDAVKSKSGGGGGGGGRRGGRGGGGRRGGRGPKKPEVSAEDLDKQLDSYINKVEED